MLIQDSYKEAHVPFGIDEVYVHDGLDLVLLKKLQQRSEFTLDENSSIVRDCVSYDLIFIFYKRVPSASVIYRFLKFLKENPEKEKDFRKLHQLVNEEELLEAVKTQKYVLVSPKNLD